MKIWLYTEAAKKVCTFIQLRSRTSELSQNATMCKNKRISNFINDNSNIDEYRCSKYTIVSYWKIKNQEKCYQTTENRKL